MLFRALGLNDTMKGVSVKKSFMEQPWCSPRSTALAEQTKVELLSQVLREPRELFPGLPMMKEFYEVRDKPVCQMMQRGLGR